MTQNVILTQNWKSDLLPYLPKRIRELIAAVDARLPLEELRIRANAPLQLIFTGGERLLYAHDGGPAATVEDCRTLLQRLCGQSLYAWERELSDGYLTLPGGYRVGMVGGMSESEGVRRLTEATGFNIRVARSIVGASEKLMPRLISPDGRLLPTLVISAPGCGKTTLLRDIARAASTGLYGLRPCRVAVVDTRYELAGCAHGTTQLDVGARTDVLSGVPRAEGMRMMVTNMSPEVLITDELSTSEDARAVFDAMNCGVTVAASAHAGSVTALIRRQPMQRLLRERLFSRIVLLGLSRGAGTVEEVFDGMFRRVPEGEMLCSVRLLS